CSPSLTSVAHTTPHWQPSFFPVLRAAGSFDKSQTLPSVARYFRRSQPPLAPPRPTPGCHADPQVRLPPAGRRSRCLRPRP
uniref:Uncharacterized protein n=1 Tax=Aegilops tauschii subsp. strangulata TaxID=200361 RepID=A0A453MCT7_AEGTS